MAADRDKKVDLFANAADAIEEMRNRIAKGRSDAEVVEEARRVGLLLCVVEVTVRVVSAMSEAIRS
jgi:hypothetical protein